MVKFAYKNGFRGSQSDVRISNILSNTIAVKNLCLLYLPITPPSLFKMLVWAYSVDPLPLPFLTFKLPGFLWQPLLSHQ